MKREARQTRVAAQRKEETESAEKQACKSMPKKEEPLERRSGGRKKKNYIQ